MSRFVDLTVRLIASVEHAVDRVRYSHPSRRTGRNARVVPYDGYGTPHALILLGRVLRNPPLGPSTDRATLWQNLVATYRRFETDEIPRARIRITAAGSEREAIADEEGHFRCRLALEKPLAPDAGWTDVAFSLLDPEPEGGPTTTVGQALVPAPHAAFGVISDIDDTVVRTDVRQFLRMVRTIVFGNARTRLPFPGVAAFYRALERGHGGAGPNPLFYVSSSPWNLHDLLLEFFELQGIPRGPLLLRDWGITAHELGPTRHGSHKQAAIRALLDEYPSLPFILIGDSGQEDPEIYASVVHDYPERIMAIYIREVTSDPRRTEAIHRLAAEVEQAHSTLILAEDTVGAATHAAERGWIDPDDLRAIAGEAEEDDPEGHPAPPTIVEG